MTDKFIKEEKGKIWENRAMTVVIAGAIILMGLGGVLSNAFNVELFDWWLITLAIPFGFLAITAVRTYRESGRVSMAVLVGMASLILLYAVFSLGLSWNIAAPIYIIFGGLFVLESVWK